VRGRLGWPSRVTSEWLRRSWVAAARSKKESNDGHADSPHCVHRRRSATALRGKTRSALGRSLLISTGTRRSG
jgi:hypothetical protein